MIDDTRIWCSVAKHHTRCRSENLSKLYSRTTSFYIKSMPTLCLEDPKRSKRMQNRFLFSHKNENFVWIFCPATHKKRHPQSAHLVHQHNYSNLFKRNQKSTRIEINANEFYWNVCSHTFELLSDDVRNMEIRFFFNLTFRSIHSQQREKIWIHEYGGVQFID